MVGSRTSSRMNGWTVQGLGVDVDGGFRRSTRTMVGSCLWASCRAVRRWLRSSGACTLLFLQSSEREEVACMPSRAKVIARQ
jgi:hypothetical protein